MDSPTSSASGAVARSHEEEIASVASYIADMSSELSQLAQGSELQMVAYFLNLASIEAELRAREFGGYPISRAAKRQPEL